MNENVPKVSITLPTYNGAKYLRESIDSCLNQTHKNIELIIVDDGSTDTTQEIVKSYSDRRMQYIRNETNLGIANSLNKGFSFATGDYLTWTSDDNMYFKNAIEVMVEELERHKNVDFVYANRYLIDEEGNAVGRLKAKPIRHLDIENYIGPCFLYRKKVYEELGGYDSSFYLAEDYEYWLRVRKKFRMKRLNKYLYYSRFHLECLRNKYPEKIEKAQKRVRDKYIVDTSLKDYFRAEEYFLQGDKKNCILFLKKSMLRNPLNLKAIRLLLLTILPDVLVKRIREVKSYLSTLLKI